MRTLDWYRLFVYQAGGVKLDNKASIPADLVEDVVSLHGKLRLTDRLQYRMLNFSEGVAVGSRSFIENIQHQLGRKFIRPRPILKGVTNGPFFATRILRE